MRLAPFNTQVAGVKRKPLRNLKELAEEFGVPNESLRGLLAKYPGPAPVFSRKTGQGQTACNSNYYDPEKMRAWWKKVQAQKGESK